MLRFSLIFASCLMVTACGSGSGSTNDGASSDQATTIGTRWSSPLKAGRYDSDDVTLNLYTWADRQTMSLNSTWHSCSSKSVDVSNGKVTVKNDDCDLTFTPDKTSIYVHGTIGLKQIDATFTPRDNGNLAKSYEADPWLLPDSKLVIHSADDTHLHVDLRVKGTDVLTDATATSDVSLFGVDSLYFDTSKCNTSFGVERKDGKFTVYVEGKCGADEFRAFFD